MPPTQFFVIDPDSPNGKRRVPGVTTIVKFCGESADGLIQWAWKVGYDGQTLDDARQKPRDAGKIVHAMIEADVRGQDPPDLTSLGMEMREKAERAFSQFIEWKRTESFETIGAELSLVSQKHGYGGTMDLARTNGRVTLMDYKAGKGPYIGHLVQLAGYGGLWAEHNPDKPIERFELLRISAEGAFHHHSWEAAVLRPAWRSFLLALEQHALHARMKEIL
jgi:hypothetical protein